MTMRIVFLEKHRKNEPGDDAFMPRQKARRLCEEGMAIPYSEYTKLVDFAKSIAPEKAQEDAPEKQQDKKPKLAKKPAPPKRKYKKREKAVTVDDSATEK